MVLKDTRIWPCAMVFGAAYLGLEMLHQFIVPYLETDSSLLAYMGCLWGAAIISGVWFQITHRRTFSRVESRRLTHQALLITSLITLVDTLVAIGRVFGFKALKSPLETLYLTVEYPALLAAVLLGFVLLTYLLLRICFACFATWHFAAAVRREPNSPPATTE